MPAFAEPICIVPPSAIETVSGRYVDVANPVPETIVQSDICWALARQARFAGHTISENIWNVAQHSVFVADLVDMALDPEDNCDLKTSLGEWLTKTYKGSLAVAMSRLDYTPWLFARLQLHCLLHDSTEAFLIDLPSPVKRQQALREPYKELEARLCKAIYAALKLPEPTELEHQIVVWADLVALQIEAANLMPSRGRGWNGDLPFIDLSHVSLFPSEIWTWKKAFNALDQSIEFAMGEYAQR